MGCECLYNTTIHFFFSFSLQLGWSIGPEHLIKHLQTVMQNSLYTCPTPLQASYLCVNGFVMLLCTILCILCVCDNCTAQQEAVGRGLLRDYELMGQSDCYFSSLALELEGKRDRMAAMLRQIGMTPVVPEGGYFMIVDVTALSKWVEVMYVNIIIFRGKGDIGCGRFNLINVVLSCLLNIDQDLSHMGDEEPYDYKFVKWMIKEKVFTFLILGIYNRQKHVRNCL